MHQLAINDQGVLGDAFVTATIILNHHFDDIKTLLIYWGNINKFQTLQNIHPS